MNENTIDLDGVWEFLHVADDRLTGPAEVTADRGPEPLAGPVPDLRMRAGIGIYRRTIEIPEDWLRDTIWIRFGAVFHNSRSSSTNSWWARTRADFCPSRSTSRNISRARQERDQGPGRFANRQPGRISRFALCRNPVRQAELVRPAVRHLAIRLLERRDRRPYDAHQAPAQPRDRSGHGGRCFSRRR